MNRPAMRTFVTLALVAVGAIWFFSNFERVPERRWVGMQGEARRNPYLAAQRMLERMGVGAREIRAVPALRELPPGGTLVLPDRREALTPDLRKSILDWVAAGGHLIVEDEEAATPDPLLDAIGVTRRAVKTAPEPGASRRPTPGADAIEVRLPGVEQPLRVAMHSQQTIDAKAPLFRVDGIHATHLLHLAHGKGRITVLNDTRFLSNRAIRELDHAEFTWQLTRLVPTSRTVLFFNSPQQLSLWRWLREHAWAALAGAAALLAAWLWRIAPRFGPIAPDPEHARRRLLDHLRASGRFHWSRGTSGQLLEAAREAALRRVGRAHPDFLALSGLEREAHLTALFGITAEDARRVLQPSAPRSALEFMHAIRIFQTIHERLERSAP